VARASTLTADAEQRARADHPAGAAVARVDVRPGVKPVAEGVARRADTGPIPAGSFVPAVRVGAAIVCTGRAAVQLVWRAGAGAVGLADLAALAIGAGAAARVR